MASSEAQYYRPGEYQRIKNESLLHGRTKKGKPKHGKTHHGKAGMHGDTLAAGASRDVWGNRDRMGNR